MNILIIVPCLTGGGAERVAASWANSLYNRGHNIGVLSDFKKHVTYQVNSGIRTFQIPVMKSRILNKLYGSVQFYKVVKNAVKAINADIVISVMHYRPLIARIATFSSRLHPIHIMTNHCAFERPLDVDFRFSARWRKFYLNRIFDYNTVLTNRDEIILAKKGFKNVSTLNNPLFLTQANEIVTKEKTILAVGRMDTWFCKGFDVLIKAWNQISDRHSDWTLKIIGNSSPESMRLLSEMDKSKNKVKFLPYTDQIAEQYQRAAIFVLSSRYEGWGLVLVEAMSQGCACVACDYLGRQAEIITDGVNGLLCKPGDSDMLANKIEQLIQDTEFRRNLQKKATESLDSLSEDNIAIQWENIIKKVLNAKHHDK